MTDLFTDPRWRKNAIVGMMLAFSGVVGLWGIGFFSFDLLGSVLDKTFRAQGLSPAEIAGKKTLWIGITSLLQNIGGFFGIYAFTHVTAHDWPQEGLRLSRSSLRCSPPRSRSGI